MCDRERQPREQTKVRKKKEEERRKEGERGLNQCHSLQLSAKKDRCSLSAGSCAHEAARHRELTSIRSCFPSSLFLL